MRDFLQITKALADPNRIRILLALRRGELCVCQIIALLSLAGSTVSKHLSILYQARLIEVRKHGRWIYYRLCGPKASAAARAAVEWVFKSLRNDPENAASKDRLEKILEMSPEELCRQQMKKSKCCSSARATHAGARWPKAGRGR